MNDLLYKPNLLYLLFVRQFNNNLKYWLKPYHRNKLLKALTICIITRNKIKWCIKLYDKLIKHREYGPAIIYFNGIQKWYINDKKHRENGPAVIDHGNQYWYINGLPHRENGPARVYKNGTTFWYSHGKRHRADGPALNWSSGAKYWFINDMEVDPF